MMVASGPGGGALPEFGHGPGPGKVPSSPTAISNICCSKQNEGARQYIGRIAALRVEQRYRRQLHRIDGSGGKSRIDANSDQARGFDFRTERPRDRDDAAGNRWYIRK